MSRFVLPRHRWALLLIVLLGFALRVYGLGDIAVNNDEDIDHGSYISDSFSDILVDELVLNNQSFAHILSRTALLTLGDRLFALRWPALLISVLGIAALYRLTGELFNRRAALFGTILLALSPLAIFYAHSFRGYSGVIHWPILLYLAGLLALKTNRRRTWLTVSLLAVMMLYTHLFTILAYLNLLLFMGIMWLAGWQRRRAAGTQSGKSAELQPNQPTGKPTNRPAAPYPPPATRVIHNSPEPAPQYRAFIIHNSQLLKLAASVALTLIMLAILYAPVWLKLLNPPPGAEAAEVVWLQRPSVSASIWYNLWLYNGYWEAGSQAGHGVLVLLPLVAAGVWTGIAAQRRDAVLALLGWALLPFIEIWLLGVLFNSFWARPPYLAYTLPPLLILAGVGLEGLFRRAAQKKLNRPLNWAVVPLLLLALLWTFALREYYAMFAGADWQAIGNMIRQNSRPSDLVICQQYRHGWQAVDVSAEDNCTRTLTYRRRADTPLLAEISTGYSLIFDRLEQAAAAGQPQRSGRVWLVVWDVPPQADLPGFQRFGSGAVLLADRHPTYAENMYAAITRLRTALPPDDSQFVYGLMAAPLAVVANQPDEALQALSLAAQYQPDHPKSSQMLARTTALVEMLKNSVPLKTDR